MKKLKPGMTVRHNERDGIVISIWYSRKGWIAKVEFDAVVGGSDEIPLSELREKLNE